MAPDESDLRAQFLRTQLLRWRSYSASLTAGVVILAAGLIVMGISLLTRTQPAHVMERVDVVEKAVKRIEDSLAKVGPADVKVEVGKLSKQVDRLEKLMKARDRK